MSSRAAQSTTEPADHSTVAAYEPAAERLFNPTRLDRIAARIRASALDRALADGADPSGSPRLAARAAVLASGEGRAQIAENLERLLAAADHPRGAWTVRPDRAAVATNRQAIRDLVELLRANVPVYVCGLASLQRLLRDGSGSVYVGDAERLRANLERARAASCR